MATNEPKHYDAHGNRLHLQDKVFVLINGSRFYLRIHRLTPTRVYAIYDHEDEKISMMGGEENITKQNIFLIQRGDGTDGRNDPEWKGPHGRCDSDDSLHEEVVRFYSEVFPHVKGPPKELVTRYGKPAKFKSDEQCAEETDCETRAEWREKHGAEDKSPSKKKKGN